MPLYNYICNNCNTTKEEFLSLSESDKTIYCSTCNQPMTKQISLTADYAKQWAKSCRGVV